MSRIETDELDEERRIGDGCVRPMSYRRAGCGLVREGPEPEEREISPKIAEKIEAMVREAKAKLDANGARFRKKKSKLQR